MRLSACTHEKEVKKLLERGQWPHVALPELRAHVGSCRSCNELALVTMAFQQARNQAAGEARIGSPGVLWWRAQLRRRNEAVERIGRSILGAQIFALAMLLLLAVGFMAWQARHGVAWLTGIEQLPQTAELHLGTLWTYALTGSGWNWIVLLPAAATVALLGGVVVYLASEKQ
jgi:hypothetical protein